MKAIATLLAAACLLTAAPAPACQQLPIVYFQQGSAAIGVDGAALLDDFAAQLLARIGEVERIEIVGHSDRTGPPAARARIARLRAEQVRDHLLARGIPAAAIAAAGAADTSPAGAGADHVREPLDRRVELRLRLTAAASHAAAARRAEALAGGGSVPLC